MSISNQLKKEYVLINVQETNQKKFFQELIYHLIGTGDLTPLEADEVVKLLINREEQMSTAIGHGVALPHIRIPWLKSPITIFARSVQGIDFYAMDNQLVHLFLCFLIPDQKYTQHLKNLAEGAKLFSQANLRRQLLHISDEEEIINFFTKNKNKNL